MDHDVVVRQKLTERYLLNELESGARDEFEEHFFDCSECALDVRVGSAFVDHSKVILAAPETDQASSSARLPVPAYQRWRLWLRPAFAAPAFAVLLAVIGYQNLVTFPGLQAANRPQVLPWASVSVASYGSNNPVISITYGQGFVLFTRIPEGGYSSYKADLYNPAGKVEWSLAIPAVAGQDMWSVQVPGARRESGTYTMKVHGITAAGESKDLGSTQFELKIQN